MGHREAGTAWVDLWIAAPPAIDDPQMAACRSLLDAAECEHSLRLRRDEDRCRFVLGRALARTALSTYTPVQPQAWVFAPGEYGRPEIAPGLSDLPLRFNLTHTDGLVACAVTIGRDVGIDVEPRQSRGDVLGLAQRFFAPAEAAALAALPEETRTLRFLEYWTLKESYVKARGLGLSLPLSHFAFTLDPIRIAFDPQIEDDPASWQFALLDPTPDHVLAVAVRRGAGEADVAIDVRADLPPGLEPRAWPGGSLPQPWP